MIPNIGNYPNTSYQYGKPNRQPRPQQAANSPVSQTKPAITKPIDADIFYIADIHGKMTNMERIGKM